MPARVQRLDAAARAEVEHPPARVPDGDLRERRRRAADTEDVVGPQRAARRELAEVGRDPPVDRTGLSARVAVGRLESVDRLVGTQVDARAEAVVGPGAGSLD